MLNIPVIDFRFNSIVIKEESVVYLLGERGEYVLKGQIYVDLVKNMDGHKSIEDIIGNLRGIYTSSELKERIEYMERRSYIAEALPAGKESEAGYWHSLGENIHNVNKTLKTETIDLVNLSSLESDQLKKIFIDSDLIVDSNNSSLSVVVVDDYTQPALEELNSKFLKERKSWILVKPTGSVLWLGPLYVPEQTGCHYCLINRLKGNREVESTLQKIMNDDEPVSVKGAGIVSSINTGMSLLMSEVKKILCSKEESVLKGAIKTLDLMNLEIQQHKITKRPQCRACGDDSVNKTMPRAMELKNRIKRFTEDGGHRIFTPSETLKKFGHHISPITGVVSGVKPIFQDAGGLVSIFYGGHKLTDGCSNLNELRSCLRNKSTGKGKGETQASVSAFSEAVERYSALYNGEAYSITKSAAEIGNDGIKLEDCMLISDEQYNKRVAWNLLKGSHQFIPERLAPEREIEWTPIWSFTEKRFKYVPSSLVYIMYPAEEPAYFISGSNGLAAGNVIEEAILQGFMEVVERDAVSMWWYNMLSMPGVDLSSFDDPYFTSLTEYYSSIDRELWVLDVTNDFGIPTFVALSKRKTGDAEEIIYGCGTHFDAKIGVSRALTEMNQALYLLNERRLEYRNRSEREEVMSDWYNNAKIDSHRYLLPAEDIKPRTPSDYEYRWHSDLKEDIERCIEITENLKLEFLVKDLTQPDIGFSVVKVVVPGSREFRARFAPGRLYDVPVKMGWLKEPLMEEDLNPVCIFI